MVEPNAGHRHSMRILVVEDDDRIRSLVADVFASAGCEVLVAENGSVALDEVRNTCPHLIMLDLLMPVLDGWSFLEATAQEGLCSSTEIVLMSAYFGLEILGEQEREVRPGKVFEVLPKPFELNDLLAVLERHTFKEPRR